MKRKRRDNSWIPWTSTLLMTIIVLLVGIILHETPRNIDPFFIFLNFLTTIMQILGTLEIFLMLHLLLERFRHINNKIAPYVSWNEERCASITDARTITVTDLKMLHSILHDAQQDFNDIYKNFLFVYFISLMMNVFANIRAFQETTVLKACVFVGPPIMQLLILCAICHHTAEEVWKTFSCPRK